MIKNRMEAKNYEAGKNKMTEGYNISYHII